MVFWIVTPYSSKTAHYFRGTYRLHLQFSLQSTSAGLLGLLLDPENGSDMFLWNVGLFPNYKGLQCRIPHSPQSPWWQPRILNSREVHTVYSKTLTWYPGETRWLSRYRDGLDDRGFSTGERKFLFCTGSSPALRPIQPPIKWILGTVSLGVRVWGWPLTFI
jgi:hypothetical protein